MRFLAPFLVLASALSAGGCSPAPEPERGGSTSGPEEVPAEQAYAAGDRITADLTMHPTEEGGRSTPFYSGYRPDIAFGPDGQESACAVQLPDDLSEFAPGETHMVVFECSEDVLVDSAAPEFVLWESGQERGVGDVVFTGE
ncbi:hypothetical protein [Nocardiopsis sp. NRRL B-16309]|uniref:hypothetical protein n=1 Tax=Nocardiopsis sp. NRRL B-16309 TaxID=1519494 RepID=UPI0006ADE871|nr:hypothetical protein [Nocardiopsis sp. NRRL B-16309]KOX16978.1 hypothetical protein ADL05_10295 [Nocardiopsis sp. NRRL B-16309]